MVKVTCFMCSFAKAIRVYLPKLERKLAVHCPIRDLTPRPGFAFGHRTEGAPAPSRR